MFNRKTIITDIAFIFGFTQTIVCSLRIVVYNIIGAEVWPHYLIFIASIILTGLMYNQSKNTRG